MSFWSLKMSLASCHQTPVGAVVLQVSTFDTAVFLCRISCHTLICVIAVAHALYKVTIAVRLDVDLDLHLLTLYFENIFSSEF